MIIGLTGKFAAGKGAVADILKSMGFVYHSLSDILREALAEQGRPESRDSLREIGNALRREGGPGALAERLAGRLRGGDVDHIVDSIRNPAEVDVLARCSGFTLVLVDADQRVRYERLSTRGRPGDEVSWETFVSQEVREMESEDPTRQQLRATMERANYTLDNSADLDTLRAEVMRLIDSIGRGDERR